MADAPALDRQWLLALREQATMAPLRPRVPLWAGESVIGSVEPDFLHKIVLHALLDERHQLLKQEHPPELGWRLMGDVTVSLNQLALAMRDAGLAGAWRGEQLPVHDQFDHFKGTVERAAVRLLGIATLAVHLVGQTPDGRYWVQQRALNKSVDPGLWDTLVGGMVPASDTLESALARETMEEAGLRLDQLIDVRHGGRLTTRRPSSDGSGAGYIIEDIEWYRCTVPDGVLPQNQDGEVMQFELLDAHQLWQRLHKGSFTLDAALIFAGALSSA